MNLKEMGELLRSEREAAGLTIKEVMEATRISRRNILALEEGDEAELPHQVYAKGFVRKYAALLGLDEAELVGVINRELRTEDQYEGHREALVQEISVKGSGSPSKGRKGVWLTVLLVLVLVALLAGAVWYLNARRGGELPMGLTLTQPESSSSEQGAGDAGAAGQPMPDVEQPTAQGAERSGQAAAPAAQAPEESAAVTTSPAPAADDAAVSDQAEMSTEARRAAEAAQSEAEPARGVLERLPNGQSHVFVVQAIQGQRSWMEIEEDDSPSRELMLYSGQRVSLKFKKRLRIRLGNGGGVTAALDGKTYPIDAEEGQVRTLIFE